MKTINLKQYLLITFSFISLATICQNNKISLHFEHSTLNKGNKTITQADLYLLIDLGKIITHFIYPEELIHITQITGETKIYIPGKNEVILKQNELFKSDYNLVYLFTNNYIQDLGLENLGFKLASSEIEDNYQISFWQAEQATNQADITIKMVHENYAPVYQEYIKDNKTIKKIYYSDYQNLNKFILPLRVTEIEYLPTGDSIINRTIYSDIKTGLQANSQYFNFKIPDDAKIIE